MRSIGAGLLVLGASALTSMLGLWIVAIVLANPVVALIVIPIHNQRLAAVANR